MPKSRKRKIPKSVSSARQTASSGTVDWGGGRKDNSGKGRLIFPLIGATAVVAAGIYFWQLSGADTEFQALASAGKEALGGVESFARRGGGHLRLGQTYRYGDPYPTSGPHAPTPTQPGFYTTPRPASGLVHAMEHGSVIIYYGKGDGNIIETIKGWTNIYSGVWRGVVAVPRGGLKNQVVLSAWRNRLKLKPFDKAAAAAFIDAYRGRGPERPVR